MILDVYLFKKNLKIPLFLLFFCSFTVTVDDAVEYHLPLWITAKLMEKQTPSKITIQYFLNFQSVLNLITF